MLYAYQQGLVEKVIESVKCDDFRNETIASWKVKRKTKDFHGTLTNT